MMDFLNNTGKFLMIASIFAAAGSIPLWIWWRRNPDVRSIKDAIARLAGVSAPPPDVVVHGDVAATDADGMLSAPKSDRLQVASAKQAVTMDGVEQLIRAAVTLAEYWQRQEGVGPWEVKPRGLKLNMIVLDKTVLFRMRSREGGDPIWFKSSRVIGIKLMTFFQGVKNGPAGPARKFRNNGQETPVAFQFPGAMNCPSGTWYVVDIGRVGADKITGGTKYMLQGDYFPFVLCRQGKEDSPECKWAIYFDPRSELAQGSGGLFVCDQFEPEQEVEDLL